MQRFDCLDLFALQNSTIILGEREVEENGPTQGGTWKTLPEDMLRRLQQIRLAGRSGVREAASN